MKVVNLGILRNQFDNISKSNFKRMFLMLRDHADKLKKAAETDPEIAAIYAVLLLSAKAFFEAYNAVNVQSSFYQGSTHRFRTAMADLSSTLIRRWDVAIQNVYENTTAEYTTLLTNGRSPFQTGAYELRLSAVKTLLDKLQQISNPLLANIAIDIENWYTKTDELRSLQQGNEGKESQLRKALEDARLAAANAMHLAFFKLCVYYHPNLSTVETFYELRYLRNRTPKTKTNEANSTSSTIKPQSRRTLLSGDFTNADTFDFNNTGNAQLLVWLSSDEHSDPPADATQIAPKENVNYLAEELADGSATWKYLVVYNPSEVDAGKISTSRSPITDSEG